MKQTILEFDKILFTKKEVKIIPKENFSYPKLWDFEETSSNYILKFPKEVKYDKCKRL